jgi:hypothetical protein
MINGNTVKITFSGNVLEDFSGIDRKTAPNFQAATRTISFGAVKAGASKTSKLKIGNAGTQPLIFRSISNKNSELSIKEPKTINGAKSDFLNVTLNTKGVAAGTYKATFSLQTNDPDHSLVPVDVEYQVVK